MNVFGQYLLQFSRFSMAACGAMLVLSGCSMTVKADNGPYEIYASRAAAVVSNLKNPQADPPGVNRWDCTSAQPPVVLIHGTFSSKLITYGGLGPYLANQGLCVFALNYGAKEQSDVFLGMAPVDRSVKEVAAFVEEVRRRTGASKVSLVGHSQGGLLALYYAKLYAASDRVANIVALAPSTRGTTRANLTSPKVREDVVNAEYPSTVGQGVGYWNCPACSDQRTDSPVVTRLNKGPIAQPGIQYTVLSTLQDEVVVPIRSQWVEEPGVQNRYLQEVLGEKRITHTSMMYEPGVWKMVHTALRGEALAPLAVGEK